MNMPDWIGRLIGKFAVDKLPVKPKNMKYGIDLSHHNGLVSFAEVAKNDPKVDFVYLKATEGSTGKDNKCLTNATEAKKNGLLVSYYHFATLNNPDVKADAVQEATFFLDTISKYPANDLPLVLDIESTNPKVDLNKEQVLTYILSFFDTLKQAGKDFALYSYTPFLNEHLPSNHGLGNIPLWIAQYSNRATPKLPNGWDKAWLWQFKGSAPGFIGKCRGVNTACDLNSVL